MRLTTFRSSLIAAFALLAGCATVVKHSDAPMSGYDKNTKYSVEPRPDGFGISVYYSRYQFVPESDAVAMACKQALTSIAHEQAAKRGREIEQVNEQAVRLSMGRNGLSGITSCSAYAPVKWKASAP
jgi:hypothetical protein